MSPTPDDIDMSPKPQPAGGGQPPESGVDNPSTVPETETIDNPQEDGP